MYAKPYRGTAYLQAGHGFGNKMGILLRRLVPRLMQAAKTALPQVVSSVKDFVARPAAQKMIQDGKDMAGRIAMNAASNALAGKSIKDGFKQDMSTGKRKMLRDIDGVKKDLLNQMGSNASKRRGKRKKVKRDILD